MIIIVKSKKMEAGLQKLTGGTAVDLRQLIPGANQKLEIGWRESVPVKAVEVEASRDVMLEKELGPETEAGTGPDTEAGSGPETEESLGRPVPQKLDPNFENWCRF